MRVFLALPIPLNLARKIHSDFSYLREGVKLVPPENMHITLNFLGEKSEREVELIKEHMHKFELEKFPLELVGLDAFPSKNFIRVLYIGVKIERDVEEKLKEFSTSFEGEPFSSLHLTFARVRKRISFDFRKKVDYGEFFVDRIVLYQSILKKPFVEYKELNSLKLRQS